MPNPLRVEILVDVTRGKVDVTDLGRTIDTSIQYGAQRAAASVESMSQRIEASMKKIANVAVTGFTQAFSGLAIQLKQIEDQLDRIARKRASTGGGGGSGGGGGGTPGTPGTPAGPPPFDFTLFRLLRAQAQAGGITGDANFVNRVLAGGTILGTPTGKDEIKVATILQNLTNKQDAGERARADQFAKALQSRDEASRKAQDRINQRDNAIAQSQALVSRYGLVPTGAGEVRIDSKGRQQEIVELEGRHGATGRLNKATGELNLRLKEHAGILGAVRKGWDFASEAAKNLSYTIYLFRNLNRLLHFALIDPVENVSKRLIEATENSRKFEISISGVAGGITRARDINRELIRESRDSPLSLAQLREATLSTALLPSLAYKTALGTPQSVIAQSSQFASLATRLGQLEPQQGVEGATFAIRQLLQGDTTPLRRRFGLSASVLSQPESLGGPTTAQLRTDPTKALASLTRIVDTLIPPESIERSKQLITFRVQKIRDNIEIALAQVGDSGVFNKTVSRLESFQDELFDFFSTEKYQKEAQRIGDAIDRIVGNIAKGLTRLVNAITGTKNDTSTVEGVVTTVGNLFDRLAGLTDNLPGIMQGLGEVLGQVTDKLGKVADSIIEVGDAVRNFRENPVGATINGIGSAITPDFVERGLAPSKINRFLDNDLIYGKFTPPSRDFVASTIERQIGRKPTDAEIDQAVLNLNRQGFGNGGPGAPLNTQLPGSSGGDFGPDITRGANNELPFPAFNTLNTNLLNASKNLFDLADKQQTAFERLNINADSIRASVRGPSSTLGNLVEGSLGPASRGLPQATIFDSLDQLLRPAIKELSEGIRETTKGFQGSLGAFLSNPLSIRNFEDAQLFAGGTVKQNERLQAVLESYELNRKLIESNLTEAAKVFGQELYRSLADIPGSSGFVKQVGDGATSLGSEIADAMRKAGIAVNQATKFGFDSFPLDERIAAQATGRASTLRDIEGFSQRGRFVNPYGAQGKLSAADLRFNFNNRPDDRTGQREQLGYLRGIAQPQAEATLAVANREFALDPFNPQAQANLLKARTALTEILELEYKLELQTDDVKRSFIEFGAATRAALETNLGKGIADVIRGVGDLRDVLQSFVDDLIDSFSQLASKNLLQGLLGDFLIPQSGGQSGALGGILGSVFGAFTGGLLGPGSPGQLGGVGGAYNFKAAGFAEGGIVTRPTYSVVGEAGAEAIIPLSRGRAVPVEMRGGSGGGGGREPRTYVVRSVAEAVAKGYSASMDDLVVDTVVNNISRGGAVSRAMRKKIGRGNQG